jgi:hypothetical protein
MLTLCTSCIAFNKISPGRRNDLELSIDQATSTVTLALPEQIAKVKLVIFIFSWQVWLLMFKEEKMTKVWLLMFKEEKMTK